MSNTGRKFQYGEPRDVEGECNARLIIGDNFGDNHATMRCSLKPGHDFFHREKYIDINGNPVIVTWVSDHSEKLLEEQEGGQP